MSEFKVGDKVRIKSKDEMVEEGHEIKNPTFQDMFGGQIAVIQKFYGSNVKLEVRDNYKGYFYNPTGRRCSIKKYHALPNELFQI